MDSTNQNSEGSQGSPDDSGSNNINRKLSSLVEIPQITLPTGGGAIRSIDEKFEVNAANGTASFSLPLPISSGRNGFTPTVSLNYNSGSGNSIFGIGWNLNIPSIQIKTDTILPKYDDSDIYQFTGMEDLVPYLKESETAAGEWDLDEGNKGHESQYHVQRYRPRTEGAYAKIEKITHASHGSFWKVTDRNNIVTILGRSPLCRIANPEESSKIFKWLAEFSYDDKGNWIKYTYKEENSENVQDILSEVHRKNNYSMFTNQHLKRVQYGNQKAYYPNTDVSYDPPDPFSMEDAEMHSHFFEIVLDYGEHHPTIPQSTEDSSLKWKCRADAFSSYRSGFEIRTNRICERILMFHKFSELGLDPYLTKSLNLRYTPSNLNSSGQSETTYLSSAQQAGFIKKEDGSYSKKALPPIDFEYQSADWNKTIHEVDSAHLANTPSGLTNKYQWTDLYGEGISGILSEQLNGWFYKQNLGNIETGNAQFAPLHKVVETPAIFGLNENLLSLQDLDANGKKQLVVNSSVLNGYYPMDTQSSAKMELNRFVSFKAYPTIDWQDPNTRFIDLNGDGRPDLVISEENAFVWYENKGKEGYNEAMRTVKALDEDQGPNILFSDSSQSIFLADLSGDGLTDIVRIRNGEICYWPNKGFGNFGAKVSMHNAPVFDLPDQYNPDFLHLADLSGTGATDLIYLGKNKFNAFINLSGNGWSASHDIDPFVKIDSAGKLSVIDLLGTGTSCIVWSTALPGQYPMRYIDLMNSKKPHVMTGHNNNMGKEVSLNYKSSTYYYLKDKRAGNPWATKLPFPVQVVASTTSFDHISSSSSTICYQYHHGYFDHDEREFRGFGMVEQTDQESFETYNPTSPLDIPPIRTKTWIHTGSYFDQDQFSRQYEKEYYRDSALDYTFPNSHIENQSGMSIRELRESARALKGKILRKELYTLDGKAEEAIPYTVTETNFTVTQIQPNANEHYGAYQCNARETLSYNCERNTSDPRITHQFVLAEDSYGQATQIANITYPRRSTIVNAYPEQQVLSIIIQTTSFENEETLYYRLGLPTSQKQFEIRGLSLATDGFFTKNALITELEGVLDSVNVLLHDEPFTSGVQARLIAWSNNYYKQGALKSLALSDYQESIVLSSNGAINAFDGKLDSLQMQEAKYEERHNHWWVVSEKPSYLDEEGFYLAYQSEDIFGNTSSITYDKYLLAAKTSIDALNNTVICEIDYRTLSVNKVTDINNSISEVITDELDMVIATTTYGTEKGVDKGDQPASNYIKVANASLEDVIAKPLIYLQEATAYFFYHIEPWKTDNLPPHFVQIQRETHVTELTPTQKTKVQITLGYSDGFGRDLQTKVKLSDDEWLVSGRMVYNNKEKPIKQYEPFITNTYLYQTEEEIEPSGVTPILHYDALARLIKTETPEGFFTKVEFDPWQIVTFDQNDTVEDSPNYFKNSILIGTTDAKGITLEKALKHYNTPITVILDSLGREFMSIQLKEQEGDSLISYKEFDILGRAISQTDPRQYELNKTRASPDQTHNFTYTYDLPGNLLKTSSQDAGTTYSLINSIGNPVYILNARDYLTKIEYDQLHRPIENKVTGGGLSVVAQRMEYGTSGDKNKNQNGRLIKSYDQAGIKENTLYDYKGQLLEATNQLCRDYKTEPNWFDPTLVPMEVELFESNIQYDALNRAIRNVQPDGSVHLPEYHSIGWLKGISIQLRESIFGTESTAKSTSFINNIDYNAKGQRTKIEYANKVSTSYTYDSQTFRLTSLITQRTEATGNPIILQDISYLYDPIGNIIQIRDNSFDTVFTAGQMVDATSKFVYDALYQLKEATGREHLALSQTDYQTDAETFKNSHFAHINDAKQLRNYSRIYTYDDSGNMLSMQHIGKTPFTREFNVSNTSNRAILTDPLNTSVNPETYFDEAGNMVQMEHLAGINWNSRNSLASATIVERSGENDEEYYVYDGSGQRLRKIKETYNNANELLWVEEKIYLGGIEIKRKYQGTSKIRTENRTSVHVMDDQKRIALVHYWDESKDASITLSINKIQYQLGNHLGSASLELDDKGHLISYEEYFPFGGTSYTAGNSLTEVKLKEYKYTGKERDDATGLYYYGARYYASWMGRWLNPDPSGTVDGLNLYQYVSNNPINLTDPNGKEESSWVTNFVGVVQIIGGAVEVGAGLAGGAATSWTGVGAVAGGVVALHGADTVIAGVRTLWTGEVQQTFTESGVTYAAGAVFEEDTAAWIGFGVDTGVGLINPANWGKTALKEGVESVVTSPTVISTAASVTEEVSTVVPKVIDSISSTADSSAQLADNAFTFIDDAMESAVENTPEILSWNQFQSLTGGLGLSRADVSASWAAYKIEQGITATSKSARQVLGYNNPSINSRWGQELIQQWLDEGLAQYTDEGLEFFDQKLGIWFDEGDMQMGHKLAAVDHWNDFARYITDPIERKNEIELFMKEITNYRPEFYSINAEDGARMMRSYLGLSSP